MKLHYKKIGEGQPMVILHGLMGLLDNWQTPAKKLAEHFEVYSIDQRNHGRSPHSTNHNYELMAADLADFIEQHQLENMVLVGHSMGGKTAMKYCLDNGAGVEKLVVVDIAPKQYPVHHRQILDGLLAINLEEVKSRGEAEEVLEKYVPEWGVRQFLLKNMYWIEKGKLAWRFNLATINNEIAEMGAAITNGQFNLPTLFIKGEKSDYIQDGDMDSIIQLFPDAELKTISDAGHWVHAEQQDAFLEELLKFAK